MSIGRADIAGDTAEYTPSVDAVSDFTLQTGALSAQYGGGLTAVANFNIKSGTNQFHGTGYEYLFNNALNANSFDNNATGIPKSDSVFKQNNFGGSFGGPVFIPKLYNGKNKTFFFFSYEGTRTESEGIGSLKTLPTSDFKDGNFSSLLNPAFTGNPNSGTVIGTNAAGNPVVFGAIYDPHSTTQLPMAAMCGLRFRETSFRCPTSAKFRRRFSSWRPFPIRFLERFCATIQASTTSRYSPWTPTAGNWTK